MSSCKTQSRSQFARSLPIRRPWIRAAVMSGAALGMLSGTSPVWAQPTWEVFQLTTGSVLDLSPAVDGTTYVWQRLSGGPSEIYMWTEGDNEPTIISTDNEEFTPRISDGRVVWESLSGSGSDYDVFLWENGSAAPLFNNDDDERLPDVGGYGMVWRLETWWLVYDNGQEQIEITAGVSGIDEYPRVHDDFLVWEASTTGNSNGTEIFYWDNGTLVQLTSNSYADRRPETDGETVVWYAANGPSGSEEIMRWTPGGGTTQLTDNTVYDTQPDVSGDVVVFARDDGNDFEIFFRYFGTDYQITDNNFHDFEPAIDGDRVVWNGHTSEGVRHIYYAILSGLDGGSPPGACCVAPECQVLFEQDCVDAGGVFVGEDTVCSPELCFPEVTVHPLSQTKCVGEAAIFSVEATGFDPLSYQWRQDGLDIPDAESPALDIPSVDGDDAGAFTCVVTNVFGSVESDAAILTVFDDSNCSDGIFCNGAEVCLTAGSCGQGSDPCPEPDLPVCNEQENICEPACQGDEECDDGDSCNGVEVCNFENGRCEIDNPTTCFGDNDAFTTSEDKLWGVDLTDGSEWLIGTAFSTQWLVGLTFDPTTGQLYAVETDEIVILDTTDGHVLWSGTHGLSLSSTPSGLAFDGAGNLYMVHDGITYTVDTLTGLATELGSNSLDNSGSLAFSPDGQLYAIGAHPDLAGFSGLARLDPDTGELIEVIGPLTDPVEPGGFLGGMGIDFDSRGLLYMSNSVRDALYIVSLENATVTEVGTLPVTFGSLAIFRDCNGNGVHDAHDLATGTSPDSDANGIPDECAFCGDGICDDSEYDCICPADCGFAPSSELPGATCVDGEDNDCDLLTDCEDPDCADEPICAPPPTPGGPGDLLYTSRGGNHRVQRLDGVTGQFLHQIPTQPVMSSPAGLVIGNDGLLYVASSSSRMVARYNLETGLYVDTFVESESGGLNGPWDIAFGPDAHLYIVDRNVGAVRRYDGETGAYIDDFVSPGSGGLFDATGLVFHPSGDLLVASGFGQNILRFDGSSGDYVGDFVPPQEGGLLQPYGLVYGPDGNLYVSSKKSEGEVFRFDGLTGEFMDVFVTKGSGDLSNPIGLAFGPDGHLYVSSTTGNFVMRYDGETGEFIGGFAYGPLLVTPRYLIFQPPECLENSDCDDGDAETEDICFTYECHHPPFSRLFVDADANGENNGGSWDDAYTDLQDALDAAESAAGAIEIWVAEGTYTPDRATGDQTASFYLRDGEFLYGGFEGTETSLEERDPDAHPTILSGDLEANDDPEGGPGSGSNCCVAHEGLGCDDEQCEQVVCEINPECCTLYWNVGCGVVAEQNCCELCAMDNLTLCDNSHHVVVASDSGRDAPAVMDGFIVTGGNANGPDFKSPQDRGGGLLMFVGSPTISNCTFIANAGTLGAGMHCESSSRPLLTNVAFLGNNAETGGGGLGLHSHTDAILTNCIFSGNTADLGGGLFSVNDCRPTLTNCTLTANTATDSGGGIYNFGSTWKIGNSILWDNSDSGGSDESAQLDGNANWFIDYCCIQGWTGEFGGEGNSGDCSPLLQDPAGEDGIPGTLDDDLHLVPDSPAVDTGDNSADINANLTGIQPIPNSDLDNLPRIRHGIVDKGAYEVVWPCTADIDGDGSVDAFDLAQLLGSWGPCVDCPADINGDGEVDAFDLALLLGGWGPC